MKIDEAIKILKNILNTKDKIDKIQDKEEREIEYSAYLEDMPFEAIETVLKNRKKYVDKDIIIEKIDKKIQELEEELLELNQREFALYEDTINEKIKNYKELKELLEEENKKYE